MSDHIFGFAGLGQMGARMSRRLAEGGHEVIGYDVRPVTFDHLGTVEDLGTLAHETDTIVLSLPDGAIVADACAKIAAAKDRRTTTIIDMSTIGPQSAREIAAALQAQGIKYVDAPVSGGIVGADQGTLSMMVATDTATYERFAPMLEPIAKNRFHVGEEPGQGQAMKLANNFLSGTTLLATSEAVAFAVKQGLAPELVVDVLNVSSGRSSASLEKFPRAILPGTYKGGFATHLMTKDVRLYGENVQGTSEFHEISDTVAAIWRRFEDAAPESDTAWIYEWVKAGGPASEFDQK